MPKLAFKRKSADETTSLSAYLPTQMVDYTSLPPIEDDTARTRFGRMPLVARMAAVLLPLILPRRRQIYAAALPFSAYLMHILFHNDGPFQADFLIWYVFAMYVPALGVLAQSQSEQAPGTQVSWRFWADRARGIPAASAGS